MGVCSTPADALHFVSRVCNEDLHNGYLSDLPVHGRVEKDLLLRSSVDGEAEGAPETLANAWDLQRRPVT